MGYAVGCMALLFFVLLSFFTSAQAGSTPYVDDLIQKAQQIKLSSERDWHLLLHYMPRTLLSGVKSEVDDPGFFVSPKGKTDPKAELEATLRSFFSHPEIDPTKQHPQCKFIARYHWLKDKLNFDPSKLPEQKCETFEDWKRGISPETVTIIFASYYVNNPSSMFGHTMLRFDPPKENQTSTLLSYAVNYAADTGRDSGFLFMVYGLTGGYKGTFSIYPYYFKVREYNNFDSRDLWEYKLSLTKPQVDRLVDHLWELGHSYLNYFFFDENCSYHLLSLLEFANPNLHLRGSFHGFVAPSDTLKILFHQPNLIENVVYRPSILSQFRQKQFLLTRNESALLSNLIFKKDSVQDGAFSELSAEKKSLLVDSALDYFAFKNGPKKRTPDQNRLLTERSKLPPSPEVPNTPISSRPETGHESARVGVAFGSDSKDSFEEFRFRWVFHDILAQEKGYPENAGVEGLQLHLRYYNEENKFHVEEGTGVRITSLFPVDSFIQKPSWNVSFGLETERNNVCGRCNSIYLRGGPGISFESHIGTKEVYYAFLNGFSENSPWSSFKYRIGPQAQAGVYFDLGHFWRVHLTGFYDYSPIGKVETNYTFKAEQRFSLQQNIELRVEASKFANTFEGLLACHVYF